MLSHRFIDRVVTRPRPGYASKGRSQDKVKKKLVLKSKLPKIFYNQIVDGIRATLH